MFNLRDYQNESVDAIINLQDGEKGLIVLPTGAGKTVVLSEICRRTSNRVLIVVISSELREQTIDKIKQMCGEEISVGSVQANLDEIDSKICVATRQSLTHKKSTRVERMLSYGEFEYVVFDEVHQAVDQCDKIIKKINNKNTKVIGLTATPFNDSMLKIFDKITYSKDIMWMIENDYLCEPKAYQIQTTTDISKVKSVGGEFVQSELELTVNNDERNDLIVKAYKEYANNRKHTLVFATGIDHSKDLCDEFNKQGISCGFVDSTLTKDERENALNNFRNGTYKVMCNVGVLTTGFDFPEVDCIMFCRPTKSKILYIQCLGRGLRKAEDKENCLVLDFKDIVAKHNLMDISSVFDVEMQDGETPREAIQREKEAEQKEKERIEKERIKREEERRMIEEIIAKEMELFNTNLDKTFKENSYYDWFKINFKMYALSESSDMHYVVYKEGSDFYTFKVITTKNKQSCEELDVFSNCIDAIKYIENDNISDARSFAYKNVRWKKEEMTPNQRKYVKSYSLHTKWDAHIYFSAWQIKKQVELNF